MRLCVCVCVVIRKNIYFINGSGVELAAPRRRSKGGTHGTMRNTYFGFGSVMAKVTGNGNGVGVRKNNGV